MASLGSYYGLCPLIDQRNLLGITQDCDPGNVIVTLGKNISIMYRLSDQKQIHSWRTKDKFSSAVIYDSENEQYVALFNQIYIRKWKGNEENLDKLKKYKFNQPIYALTTCLKKAFVVFNNANVVPLNLALENRKSSASNHSIGSIQNVTTSALNNCMYVGVTDGIQFICYIFNGDKHETCKIDISRNNPDIILTGHTLTSLEDQDYLVLLTLWSDGKLYSFPIRNDILLNAEPFGIVESLLYKQPVTMVALQHQYIAMYGANTNDEGSILVLYNLQYKVSQLKQPLKLFTPGAKLWQIENNLLFCVGENLAVMPYSLESEQLAALVGSHRAALSDMDADVCVIEELQESSWDAYVKTKNITFPKILKSQVSELSKQGMSESMICDQIIPTYIKTNNVDGIKACLNYFKDISEPSLAHLLKFSLQNDHHKLVDRILSRSFSDILLLPYIRSDFDLNNTLALLQHIHHLMSNDGYTLPSLSVTESDRKLIEWSCLLLDANYQKLLLSKHPDIIETLRKFSKLVEDHLVSLENMKQLEPLLRELKRRKVVNKSKPMVDLKYSIEQLSLY